MSDPSRGATGLSPSKRALLESMLRGRRAGEPVSVPIPRRDDRSTAPLSFAQARLWFIHQVDPSSPAYNVPNALRLRGALDRGLLERCLGEVVRRHDTLRTHFDVRDGAPAQIVSPDESLEIEGMDLSALEGEAREAETVRLASEEARTPFDLGNGPLIRARLLRLAADDHVLLLTMHHIVSDGWSMGVLVREIGALYPAFGSGRPSPLPDLSIQYADFAAWQRATLTGDRLDEELAYWRGQLTPLPPALELPADRPRPAVQTFRGGVERLSIPPFVAERLRGISRSQNATLFMTLLAAFDGLLSRLTGEEDVAIGTGIANRTHPDVEPLIGFFVNALVLRVSCAGDPSFRELVDRSRETTVGAFAHQDLPFERIVEELRPERDLSRNPVFQIAFALQNAPLDDLDLPGLSIGPVVAESGATRFDLEFHVWEAAGGGLEGYLFYSSDLFDRSTVRRIADMYATVLDTVAAEPGVRLSRLPIAAREEIEMAAGTLGRGEILETGPEPPHRLFESRARENPGAVAVVDGPRTTTYRDLDAAADRLAGALRAEGVGRGSRVAILAERSIELVLGALAAHKAGASYVPLDPNNPDHRLAAMVSQSSARRILAQGPLASRAARLGAEVIGLDPAADARGAAGAGIASPSGVAGPSDLAYVVFTSGSTGEPNGVEVTHAGLANLVAWHRRAFDVRASDIATLVAGVGFDASAWEIWPYLASGARLLVPDEPARLDPASLRDFIVAHAVTIAFLPTPIAERLLALDIPGDAALRALLTGGDRLHRVRAASRRFRVVNNYGPTETSVVATSGDVDGGASLPFPTIGRPIANASALVLDARMRPLPLGVSGEIWIGGAGVARGYAGRPDLTADRFLPDPFTPERGARIYRTGDRGRLLADGRIEFLGRLDGQLKVRGQRIEPAEIETALASHPGVEAAAVVAREAHGEARLSAYVVARAWGGDAGAWSAEHVARWRALYDATYARKPASPDAGFNVTGWNSSYTGAPIPEGEMREWRDTTVERILALAPKRVLEIGCGTGLLLTQIAPRCERYAATDFSRVSLDLVRGAVSRRKDLAHVELFERGGDDFGGFETAGFDLVVLNSVVQYFPDVSYLDRVLDGALRSLSPGGRVFVGDVRDARLQRVFAASVALHGVDGATAPEEAAARADRLVAREEELLASPGYFALASKRAPGGGWAEALVKRGRADNELTRFRYDVVIHAGDPGPGNGGAARELAWAPGVTDTLVTWMESPGGPILLRGVPNARIAEHIVAARWLDAAAGGDRFVPRDAPMAAISAAHPEDLADLAAARGYAAACGLTADDEASFDVAFFPTGAQPPARAFAIPAPSRDAAPLVTAPVRSTIASALVAAVREHAAARLPESMMPSAIVLIDALPLTPSGKIDRRALASLDVGPRSGAWAPPRTPTERAVARVWSDVLGVARVGAHDGFFDLGGHSLLATQVTARLGSALGVEIPLRAIFESPTVAALASYIDRSTPSRASREPIPRVERGARLPLSVAQTRLWFIDRLEPGGAAYNIPTALRLGGRLDVVALGRTLGEISRRHEILRARIVEDAEGPSLVIEPPGADALPAEDLTRQPSPEDAARSIVAAEAVRPFDLSRGPLLRVRLLRIGPEDHVLSLVVHHIVADGWSTGVMVRELGALYDAFAHGVPSPLADLAIQYVDWSAWQRRWLDAGELDRQLAYWRGALAGVEPLGILTDRTRPPRPSYAGAAIDVSIAPAVVERVAAIAREEGATLHMALLAAYVAVLARWSGQDDLAIGTPVAGRTREETEPLVGFFVNTLALRVTLGGADPTYRELIGRVRESALGAYANQDVPFEKIVEELQPERDASRNPIFQTMFMLHNLPPATLSLGGLEVESFGAPPATAQFDIEMSLFELDGSIGGRLHFSTDIFDGPTMERLAGHFLRFLEIAARSPEVTVRGAGIVSPAERARLLRVFSEGDRPADAAPTLVDLFRAQVEARPAAPAVRFAGEDISYASLASRADAIARALLARGAGRGTRVGICLDRGADLIAAVLGVLQAGAAYVALDPAYPAERLAQMTADADLRVLVTAGALAGSRPAAGALVLDLEGGIPESPRGGEGPARVGTGPDDLVYVVYTSGTTGRPKGIAMPQSAITNLIAWQRDRSGNRPGRRTLQFSSMCFDVSVQEIFATFAEGGTLVMISEADRRDPEALLRRLEAERVERLFLPFVALQNLAEAAEGRAAALVLDQVITAGEQLRVTAEIRRLFRRLGGATLDNHYGPSEAHVVTAERLEGDPDAWPDLPSVGRPVPGMRVYVLDDRLEPVPVGVPGEIFAGGAQLARGYLHRGELSADRFVPDPFCAGGRLYRTGDRARFLPDGRIEFLGRLDRQVKVRGYRVEPAEVESAIARLRGVRSVAVDARVVRGSGARLVAWVVLDPPSGGRLGELRPELQRALPDYLVPSVFLELDALPVSPTGKIDRRALPDPEPAGRGSSGDLSLHEAMVAGIFEEILGTSAVGPDADFFDLGGHSLLATSAVARLRRLAGVEIPLRAIFEAPTVRDLAARVGEALRGGAARSAPVARGSREEVAPASFQQERMWFLERFHAGESPHAMTAALRFGGELGAGALDRALAGIERRHEALRTRFESRDGRPFQAIDAPRPSVLGRVDLTSSADPEHDLRAFVEADAIAPFDLERGPVWRASLARLGPADNVLIVTIHHIVTDGWSMSLLVRELGALYEAETTGEPSPLPELPIQYSDYAIWQRAWLGPDELERQLAYWRAELESVPPLRLPTSRSRPPLQSHRGRARTASIDGELADRLRALARAEGATLHMVLLAGFALVLSRWSGQDDFAVGTPVAGRTRQETEGLIGYFINTLALRVRPAGSGSFSELVAAIRATSLGAYSHQDVPFEAVLNALKPPRDLARSPIFQVWFNLLNFGDDDASFRSLEVRPFGAEGVASEFDLNLYVAEEARGISLRAIYAAELFEPSTLDELLRQFVAVLRQAAASPASGLADFSLVTDAAEAALPDPAEPLDASWRGSVHEIFSDNVRKTPSATAVVDDAGVMSYGELEARADRTAGWLTRHGVRKGDVVAIHARRSASTVVAILGVLKAGAAFSLLDPAHPAARLIACLTESPPRALIAVEDSTAPAGDLLRFIDGDLGIPRLGPAGDGAGEGIRATADRPGAFRGVAVGPDDLACVTFTSGSAGRPKPVRGRHGSLTHFQPYLAARFGIGPADRFSMLSGLSHDPLQRDIVTALLAGASIRIPDPAEIDPARLARWAARERITVMNLTPAMSRILAPPESDGHLPDLRLVFLVGEQLTRGDVENLRRAAPLATIVNLYGTTESQRAVGHFVISAGAPLPPTENVPAGIGMPGAQVLVRTDAGHGAGLFELGEIWIRSPHLALGYADEAATRERFSGEGGSRAYRTGDLGRHLLDGAVAVAGRRDGQMNVRGFRIEPGEIEAALAAHPGIREAAVLLDPSGRLIGYVACADASLDPVSLREALRRRLPEPMVPAKIVVLDRIPLTPNGKIDRRALPAPDWDARPSFTAPRTADEEVACALFADVLDLERVSIDDSFFDLGGHSLLATRLLSRLRASHDVEIALRSLFEAPTPAGLARSVAAARRTGPSDRPALARADSADRRRLSYAQRRLWVLDRLDPGSPAYNVASAFRLKGRLDAEALSRAVAELERRHESLTARLVSADDGPEQVFAAPRKDVLVVEDVSRREDPEAAARRGVSEEASTPFDLARGPLWRATLFRIAVDDHALSIVLHHAVTDGWSNEILAREVSLLYAAFAAGKPSPLDDLPFQYADWAAWQRRWLEAGEMHRQLAWWRRELAGAAPLDMPTDRPRSVRHGLHGESIEFEVDRDGAAALARWSRSEGITPFQILLACFQATLARHAAAGDVIVGTPIANRDLAESEPIVGFFANTLPVRARIDPGATLRELIASVRDRVLEAHAHQDAPFEEIVSALDLPRDLSRNPLFDAMFLLQHPPAGQAPGGDLTITPLDATSGATPFELTLSMAVSEERLLGSLAFDADLFDRRTAESLVEHFSALVLAVARTPDAILGDIEMRSPGEIALIEATNATHVPRTERLVGDLVEERARISPQAVAVIAEDAVLTYAELDARANRIARRLRRLGVGPEAGVALIGGRTAATIAAVLGIFKSGGAFVPLDASLPKGRLATMLEVAGVKVILAGHGLESALPPTDLPVVRLDSEEIDAEACGSLPRVTLPASAAYVIFTSGSTGEPKGSVVEQQAIAARALDEVERQRVGPGDRTLYFNSPIFDASLIEILPTLVSGAALVVHPDPGGETPSDLLARMARHRVSIAAVPVGFFHEMADEIGRSALPVPEGLRLLTMGGESPSGGRFATVLRAAPWITLVNAYGPTEAAILATARSFTGSGQVRDPVPIGVPLANTTVHLLDSRMRPVPVGAFGEIYIGGLLARGYAGRPDETARAFVPDPFAGEPGARLYRTGDIARRLADGSLVFAGRRDGQIKLRGYRIEIAEIEAVIARVEGVKEAAVSVIGAEAARRLVAYVATGPGSRFDAAAARGRLREWLPDYMIPRDFVELESMPRTATGKLDRRALPLPERAARDGARVEPRDDVERAVARLWSATLPGAAIDVERSFFESGGNSLLAVRLVAALRRELDSDLSLASVFREPTIAGLARVLRGGAVAETPLVTLRAGPGPRALVCVHEILGGVAEFRAIAGHLDPRRPVIGIQGITGSRLESIEEAGVRYARSIAREVTATGIDLLGWSYGGLVALEIARELRRVGREVGALILLDAAAWHEVPDPEAPVFARAAAFLWGVEADSPGGAVAAARRSERIPAVVSDGDAERWITSVASRLGAVEAYRPRRYDGDVVLVRAADGAATDGSDPTLGWSRCVAGKLTLEWVPGSHYSMVKGDGARAIAAIVEKHV